MGIAVSLLLEGTPPNATSTEFLTLPRGVRQLTLVTRVEFSTPLPLLYKLLSSAVRPGIDFAKHEIRFVDQEGQVWLFSIGLPLDAYPDGHLGKRPLHACFVRFPSDKEKPASELKIFDRNWGSPVLVESPVLLGVELARVLDGFPDVVIRLHMADHWQGQQDPRVAGPTAGDLAEVLEALESHGADLQSERVLPLGALEQHLDGLLDEMDLPMEPPVLDERVVPK